MKTIYITGKQWQDRSLDEALERASGGDGAAAPCWWEAASPAGKVVDLAAWRAENLVEPDAPEEELPQGPESGLAGYAGRELRRRPREKHRAALALAELAATLSAVGVMVALILRVLVF